MKIIIPVFLFTVVGSFYFFKPKILSSTISKPINKSSINKDQNVAIKTYGRNIKKYIEENNYYNNYCFLINMHIPSGKNRFFVYDLEMDSIMEKGLVTHGGGSQIATEKLTFSNIPHSNATSIGKYKIGNEYFGKFGTAFKLYGLEQTNSQAFNRFVVLHSHSCVPDLEVFPLAICTSLGCPTVAPAFLSKLKKYITEADKPMILWIYY